MRTQGLFSVALMVCMVAASPLWARDRKCGPSARQQGGALAGRVNAPGKPTIAGYVGELAISLDEVDQAAGHRLLELRQLEYEARKRAFNRLVDRKLLEKEAAARGLSVSNLLEAEIEDKVGAPTDEEVETFYEENKADFGGRAKEDVAGYIKERLRRRRLAEHRAEFYRGLRRKAGVRFTLAPPRATVPIPPDAPARGPRTAPVTMVEFADFQCSFCRREDRVVKKLLAEYAGKLRYVFRDFPMERHARAVAAARAARCAGEQGGYWQYYDSLMEAPGDLSDTDLNKRTADLGLDVAAFAACLASDRYEAAVRTGLTDGAAAGVTGTPTFFINGRMVVGARPIEEMRRIIEEELARVGERGERAGNPQGEGKATARTASGLPAHAAD